MLAWTTARAMRASSGVAAYAIASGSGAQNGTPATRTNRHGIAATASVSSDARSTVATATVERKRVGAAGPTGDGGDGFTSGAALGTRGGAGGRAFAGGAAVGLACVAATAARVAVDAGVAVGRGVAVAAAVVDVARGATVALIACPCAVATTPGRASLAAPVPAAAPLGGTLRNGALCARGPHRGGGRNGGGGHEIDDQARRVVVGVTACTPPTGAVVVMWIARRRAPPPPARRLSARRRRSRAVKLVLRSVGSTRGPRDHDLDRCVGLRESASAPTTGSLMKNTTCWAVASDEEVGRRGEQRLCPDLARADEERERRDERWMSDECRMREFFAGVSNARAEG